jgi:rubrerythrin
MNDVHCLKCDHVWEEESSPDTCPRCGNSDKQQTAYQTEPTTEVDHDYIQV